MAQVLILALITYRLATDLTMETGPFAIFENLRGWVVSKVGAAKWYWVAEGVTCPICASFWISIVIGLMMSINLPEIIAAAGLAAWLARRD